MKVFEIFLKNFLKCESFKLKIFFLLYNRNFLC